MFQREHGEHCREAGRPKCHRIPRLEPTGQWDDPLVPYALVLRVAAPVLLSHAPACDDDLIARRVAGG